MPKWGEINRCGIWKVLGVSECNDCSGCKGCWSDEVELPETNNKALKKLLTNVREVNNGKDK